MKIEFELAEAKHHETEVIPQEDINRIIKERLAEAFGVEEEDIKLIKVV